MSIKLSDILPQPVNTREDLSGHVNRDSWFKGHEDAIGTLVIKDTPAYGKRNGYLPRTVDDFGDGGAFPEIHMAQFPLGMGQDIGKSDGGKTLALQYDKDGKLRHDAIARIGHDKNKVVHSRLHNTKQRIIDPDDPELQRPNDEERLKTVMETKKAIEDIVRTKVSAALPVQHAQKTNPAQYIRYTPSQQSTVGGTQQRIIRVVEAQRDPMEPPRFQINQKIPRAPPSPPAPVLHSPPRKVTQKEQNDWKIPPCVSNWKNPKGYTVALDKRLAADGRGLQQVHVNEKFAKFSEALNLAARTSREGVEARNQMERKIAENKKTEQEKKMIDLARNAREARKLRDQVTEDIGDEEAKRRDEIRRQRADEYRKERNMAKNRPGALEKMQRDRERDISEKVALGLPGNRDKQSDTQFDHRLFNRDAGLDSGGINDETFNVYDAPMRNESNVQSIYRPRKQTDNPYGDDLDEIVKNNRFVPDRGFKGAEPVPGAAARNAPVEFQADTDDIFGIGELFQTKKDKEPTSTKRQHEEEPSSSGKRSRR